MDSKRQMGSASSFTSKLFDKKETHTSDVFASIFPPSKGVGRNSACSEVIGSWQKQPSGNQQWKTEQDAMDKHSDGGYRGISIKERSAIFQEKRIQPCYLSSSIYYGGQEIYSPSSYPHTSGSYNYKKDAVEDDPTGASRGNWWQGSLYY